MANPKPETSSSVPDPPTCSEPTLHYLTIPIRNREITFKAATEDQRETNGHRDLSVWELKRVIEKEGMTEIGELFEEKESSLMEVKEAFDVLDVNADGFIDVDELRNALPSLGFVKEVEEDDCERMIKGVKTK
ncbi:hypothetical protein V6N13_008987 [Hibiscus sabdariffa]